MALTKLLIDFGLVILIWMTQLVVYPGFTYYNGAHLRLWHKIYTTRISLIVIPLMLAQLGLHGASLWHGFNVFTSISALLVVGCWINTFGVAVPLHDKISNESATTQAAEKLVKINWYRTAMWTAVFCISIFQILRED